MEITNTANHSQYELNKYSGLPWKQHGLSKSIILFRETSGCCYPLKRKKTEDYSWFYCKQVQEMPQRTLPEAVLYQGQGEKWEVLPRLRYKKPEFF